MIVDEFLLMLAYMTSIRCNKRRTSLHPYAPPPESLRTRPSPYRRLKAAKWRTQGSKLSGKVAHNPTWRCEKTTYYVVVKKKPTVSSP